MRIELAEAADAATVADLWVDLADEQRQYGSRLLPTENEAGIREEMARHAASENLLVARDDRIVGFVAFSIERGTYERDASRGVVETLFVVPGRRDEGIGSDLLAGAERRLVDRGADAVALEAMADNTAARRFYRRRGYDRHRVTFEKSLQSDNHSKEGG